MANLQLSGSQTQPNDQSTTNSGSPTGHFLVQFWGVRGLIPTPGTNTSRYGGNTACVEIQVAGKRLIFDGGTGLRALGKAWQDLPQPLEGHLFFTNSQSNRIQGFPFFAPAFVNENCFHIYGGAASNGASIKQCLCDQMLQPHFPYPLRVMQSDLQFYHLTANSAIQLDDITITTALINQAQRSLGYRISWQGHNVAYVTDINIAAEQTEREDILPIIQDVDLLIANATYMPPTCHSHDAAELLWQSAVEIAHKASVKKLVISHHHPDDHDDFLDQLETQVQSAFPQASLACEGLIVPVA